MPTDKEDAKDEDWEMISDNFSESKDDFEIMYYVVSVLPIEYNMVTKVTNTKEEYSVENISEHKLVCYYVMNDCCVEEHNVVFEKPDIGIKSHLKSLFIKAKIDKFGVNKI